MHMLIKLIVILAVIILIWTAVYNIRQNNQAESAPATPTSVMVNYSCDDNKTITANYLNSINAVSLTLSDGRSMQLSQTMSADGARYANADESFVFWSKGNTAFVEEGANGTMTYSNCVAE